MMPRSIFFLALAAFMALPAARQARAEGELMVMPASLQVVPGHDYAVTVKNVGDGPLYLNIALQQVMNPGMEHERKLPLSEIERPGLLAHPDRLSLGRGSRARSRSSRWSSPLPRRCIACT